MASTLLEPAGASVKGALVQVLEVEPYWYNAKILDVRGEGDAIDVKVHYDGYKKRYDEWVPLADGRVRWPLAGYDITVAESREQYHFSTQLQQSQNFNKHDFRVVRATSTVRPAAPVAHSS